MNDEVKKAMLEAERISEESRMFTAYIQGYHRAQVDDKNNERFEDPEELRNHLRENFDPEEIQ